MTLVIQDVTAHRNAERELRQAEERMRVIADSLPALVAYVNKDERFDFVNRTYEEWYGMPREQIRHMPVRELLGAERYVRLEPLIKRALAGESIHADEDAQYPGRVRQTDVTYTPDFDEHGQTKGIIYLIIRPSHSAAASSGNRSNSSMRLIPSRKLLPGALCAMSNSP